MKKNQNKEVTKNSILTRKIKLELLPDETKSAQELLKELVALHGYINEAANTVINEQFFNILRVNRLDKNEFIFNKILSEKSLSKAEKQEFYDKINKLKEEKKEIYDVGMRGAPVAPDTTSYSTLSLRYGDKIPSNILTSLNSKVCRTFDANINKVLKGEVTLSNYKKNFPIPFNFRKNEKHFPLKKIENDEIVFKPISKYNFKLIFGKDKSNNKSIVEKLLSREYKLSDSGIKIVYKNSYNNVVEDVFLLLSFSIPILEREKESLKIMGVDLGINSPIAWAIDNEQERGFIGTKKEFYDHKIAFEKRRRLMQKTLSTGAVSGKGREKKIQGLNSLKKKDHNWTETTNHRYSSELIKIAIKNRVKLIKLENLEFINTKYKLLKSWPYFALQQMIIYKAKKNNIDVIFINPANTSLTCKVCGEKGTRMESDYDMLNRMTTQEYEQLTTIKGSFNVFVCNNLFCENHDKKVNADTNAAYNIAKSINYSKKKNSKEILESVEN